MTPIWIAELRVVIVHPNGRRVPGRIAVGQPYALAGADPASSYESHCPVEITSVYSSAHPIIGGGTLQSLLLAVQLLGTMLHSFVERGGRVLYPEEDRDAEGYVDVPLRALFGSMLRDADASS
jgi:hypothetical protein